MNVPAVFLAAAGSDLPKHNRGFGKLPTLLFSDVLLIVGLGLGLLLVLASGIYLWMKWRRNRRRHVSGGQRVYRGSSRDAHSEADAPAPSLPTGARPSHDRSDEDDPDHASSGSDHSSKRRYKYRVRRRSHRSRNPTLSQAGGLPPVKSNEPGKPC